MDSSILLWISLIVALFALLFVSSARLYGYFRSEQVLQWGQQKASPRFKPIYDHKEVAILIACYRGSGTIGATVEAALKTGCDVYVVDDGSKQRKASDPDIMPLDQTSETARDAGATVLELTTNGGKPKALYDAYYGLALSKRYRAVAILDDDVTIKRNFIKRSLKMMTDEVAIAVGRNITWIPFEHRWNMWLAKRAFSYWNYQLVIRNLQSIFGVMNCISGSNSVYRTELLDQVLVEKTPYIVDDTFWVLETQRRNLGRIVYVPKAHAFLQDPTNFKDWYKQNLRWMWGTFQGVIGHKVGRRATKFDAAYMLLIFQWIIYVLSAPVAIVVMVVAAVVAPWMLLVYMAGYGAWVIAAAIQLRNWRLPLFIPSIIVSDFIYRWVFVHAFFKAWKTPTVENCVWESPARIQRVA